MILTGCSTYKAATAPPPMMLDNVKAGADRITIVGTLGIPKLSETKGDSKIDVHEFVKGLAELIFWPIELRFGQGTAGRAIVTYGMDDIARSVMFAKQTVLSG